MDDPTTFQEGQRWASETQPELGLGIVKTASRARVTLYFPAADEHLTYSAENAPLRRVAFAAGDRVRLEGGEDEVVAAVAHDERSGQITYTAESGREFLEAELASSASGARPEARLKAGRPDSNGLFELRFAALGFRQQARARQVAGFVGARVALIPHQLSIAAEVAGRAAPRVLLADEVGLGKTIEACLVLHRLVLAGRAERVLVLVPDALVHQWFVELLRRFELKFALFDEERCRAVEGAEGVAADANPFYDEQLVIAPLSWLAANPARRRQVLGAHWDLVVVDEAHHLEWSRDGEGENYQLVAGLAESSPGVLLLTATPEQLGEEGHFGRLRLLDPERFSDFDQFRAEAAGFRELSGLAAVVLGERAADPAAAERLAGLLGGDEVAALVEGGDVDPETRQRLARRLVDLHGTGRVFFRNRRESLAGFPERRAHLVALDPAGAEEGAAAQAGETEPVVHPAKVAWLAEFLRADDARKVLVIVAQRRDAEALDEQLRAAINLKSGLFHEEMTLVQRDRAAAWFSEPDGARLLICSEIGSEGRNFQFCHHLVLFDLPREPDLLEQRIGRLDRIGQSETVHIHVPFVRGSAGELWARWYHEGLAAFENPSRGGRAYLEEFGARLDQAPADAAARDLLVSDAAEFRTRLEDQLDAGRDRLLELASFDRERAAELVAEIEALDSDAQLAEFVLQMCDRLGVHVERLDASRFFLRPERVASVDAFPGLPQDGLTVTFERERALEREDVTFLTWDHPLVLGALELLLGGETGNCAFVHPAGGGAGGLALEVVFVLEPQAPRRRHADRFLPPTVLRTCVDHSGAAVALPDGAFEDADTSLLAKQAATLSALLPPMIEGAEAEAERRADELRAAAVRAMADQLGAERSRLEALAEAGHPVPALELRSLERTASALEGDLAGAPLRLDSVRLIVG